jgi:hypothetical protein
VSVPSVNTPEKFWSLVEPSGFCWYWKGRLTSEVYGAWWFESKTRPVHVISWMLLMGETPPKGMHVDHLCRTRNCVNPDHLEIVTPTENSLRAMRPKMARTECVNGHAKSDPRSRFADGTKRCRQCVLVRQHRERGAECNYAALCADESHELTVSAPRTKCARGHSMDDSYARPDGDGRQCATCIANRTRKAWANRKMIACEYCGRVLSNVNMRAHQRKACKGAPSGE